MMAEIVEKTYQTNPSNQVVWHNRAAAEDNTKKLSENMFENKMTNT